MATEAENYQAAKSRCITVPKETKPTKAGVKAALIALTYDCFPVALRDVNPAKEYSKEELEWAMYLIWDTDFGGAWHEKDQFQINANLV